MINANHDKVLAQNAMDRLLVDFLIREQVLEAVRVTQITRLDGDNPCWYLWTEDNRGVYKLELKDVGQVLCGGHALAKPLLAMEADFVLQYLPFAEAPAARPMTRLQAPGVSKRYSGAQPSLGLAGKNNEVGA